MNSTGNHSATSLSLLNLLKGRMSHPLSNPQGAPFSNQSPVMSNQYAMNAQPLPFMVGARLGPAAGMMPPMMPQQMGYQMTQVFQSSGFGTSSGGGRGSAQSQPPPVSIPAERQQSRYTSESASSILTSSGLSNEDLELLSHYPEAQLTPDNLSFILRDIRVRKAMRNLPIVNHRLPSPSRQDHLGGEPQPSKVFDYGHSSKFGYSEKSQDSFKHEQWTMDPQKYVRDAPVAVSTFPSGHCAKKPQIDQRKNPLSMEDKTGKSAPTRGSLPAPNRHTAGPPPPTHGIRANLLNLTEGSNALFAVTNPAWSPSFPPSNAGTSKRLPTPTMMNDYSAASPRIFPHMCSLCNIECVQIKDWIQHQNTSIHIESCRRLRKQFPDWTVETVAVPRRGRRPRSPSPERSRSRSSTRASPPRATRRLNPRHASPRRQQRSSSSERLAKKLIKSSGLAVSHNATLEAMVESLAPALMAELAKRKSRPSSASNKSAGKKQTSPSTSGKTVHSKTGTFKSHATPVPRPEPAPFATKESMKRRTNWVDEQSRRRNEGLCFYCGEAGHRLTACPIRPVKKAPSEVSVSPPIPGSPVAIPQDLPKKCVVQILGLPESGYMEDDLKNLARPFGFSSGLCFAVRRKRAFVELPDLDSAKAMLKTYKENPPKLQDSQLSFKHMNRSIDFSNPHVPKKCVIQIFGLPESGYTEDDLKNLARPFGFSSGLLIAVQQKQAFVKLPNLDSAEAMLKTYKESPPKIQDSQLSFEHLTQHIDFSNVESLFRILLGIEKSTETANLWNRLLVVKNVPMGISSATEIKELIKCFGSFKQALVLNNQIILEMDTPAIAKTVFKHFQKVPCIVQKHPLIFSVINKHVKAAEENCGSSRTSKSSRDSKATGDRKAEEKHLIKDIFPFDLDGFLTVDDVEGSSQEEEKKTSKPLQHSTPIPESSRTHRRSRASRTAKNQKKPVPPTEKSMKKQATPVKGKQAEKIPSKPVGTEDEQGPQAAAEGAGEVAMKMESETPKTEVELDEKMEEQNVEEEKAELPVASDPQRGEDMEASTPESAAEVVETKTVEVAADATTTTETVSLTTESQPEDRAEEGGAAVEEKGESQSMGETAALSFRAAQKSQDPPVELSPAEPSPTEAVPMEAAPTETAPLETDDRVPTKHEQPKKPEPGLKKTPQGLADTLVTLDEVSEEEEDYPDEEEELQMQQNEALVTVDEVGGDEDPFLQAVKDMQALVTLDEIVEDEPSSEPFPFGLGEENADAFNPEALLTLDETQGDDEETGEEGVEMATFEMSTGSPATHEALLILDETQGDDEEMEENKIPSSEKSTDSPSLPTVLPQFDSPVVPSAESGELVGSPGPEELQKMNFITVDEVGEEEEKEQQEEEEEEEGVEPAPSPTVRIGRPKKRGRRPKKRGRQVTVRKSTSGEKPLPEKNEEADPSPVTPVESCSVVDPVDARSQDPALVPEPQTMKTEAPEDVPDSKTFQARQDPKSNGDKALSEDPQESLCTTNPRATIKEESKLRRDEGRKEKPDAKRHRTESPISTDYKMPPFSANNPIGLEFVVPKMSFFCKLCSLFYSNEDAANNTHCSSLKHYQNMEEHFQKLRAGSNHSSLSE